METAPDATRLRALFERPGLHWILDRLEERMSRGRPLLGTIVHAKSTPEERRALDDLLGRPSTRGQRLTLNLAELAQTLRSAGMAGNLRMRLSSFAARSRTSGSKPIAVATNGQLCLRPRARALPNIRLSLNGSMPWRATEP